VPPRTGATPIDQKQIAEASEKNKNTKKKADASENSKITPQHELPRREQKTLF
jgi:hypothetical protein